MTVNSGLVVDKRRTQDKVWMYVTTGPEGWPVAFRHWYEQIRILVECEVEKYGGDPNNPEDWERWGDMPKRFLARCFDKTATYEQLKEEFKLPK